MKIYLKIISSLCCLVLLLGSCKQASQQDVWDYEIDFGDYKSQGIMRFDDSSGARELSLVSMNEGTFTFENIDIGTDISVQEFQEKFPSARSVPLILDHDVVIGGFNEFCNYVLSKELGEMSI